ncbi:hypothetical protein [Pontixanthobacter luteolus]|uniref:hypothetical protein n=1 Tax=Pontixanthobacter luteolus TaxID=295089 RepID=UPI002303A157|nr:hypothetical protein [Pontixanthobacter luteolus]
MVTGFKHSIAVLGGALTLGISSPAAAQDYSIFIADVIGQTIANMNFSAGGPTCMTGLAMSDKEVDEARLPAPRVMQQYFDAARDGGQKSTQFKLGKKTRWQAGDILAGADTLNAQSDPLAVAGNRLEQEALRFYRAGNHMTALGQWAVLAPDDTVAGVYTGLFERESGEWLLRELDIFTADQIVEPAAQYCLEPGDVTAFKISSAENWVKTSEGQLEKAEEKLAKQQVKQQEIEAKAASKPNSKGLKTRAQRMRNVTELRIAKVDEKKEQLAKAKEQLVKMQDGKRELDELAGEARLAQRFRIVETEEEAAASQSPAE